MYIPIPNTQTVKPQACSFKSLKERTMSRSLRPGATIKQQRLVGTAAKQLLVSLERSVGARQGWDQHLSEAGSFDYEVYPDLPIDTNWRGYFGRLLSSPTAGPEMDQEMRADSDGRRVIQTVGCQTRSRETLCKKLQSAARQHASGVLILSGSHPAHRLAAWLGRSPASMELLKLARNMKAEGILPSKLALWGVENPLRNPAFRLAQKLDAGAEVILTQPPFAWQTFASWWEDIHRMGLTEQGSIVVGIPMVTSISNMRFWLQLCDATSLPEAASTLQGLQKEAHDKESAQGIFEEYNRKLVTQVLRMPGVGGIHIMPLTKVGRQQVLKFQREGVMPKADT